MSAAILSVDVIWNHSLRGCDEWAESHYRVPAYTATSSNQEQGSAVDHVVFERVFRPQSERSSCFSISPVELYVTGKFQWGS